MTAATIALALPLFTGAAHAARCNCACADEYHTDIDLCQTITSNGHAGYDRACVQNASEDYHTCVDDCSDPLGLIMR